MPNVLSFTPPWLCRPYPGSRVFTSNKPLQTESTAVPYEGPNRTLARRGTEVFAVVDNEIRWSNLTDLRDDWETRTKLKKNGVKQKKSNGVSRQTKSSSPDGEDEGVCQDAAKYRVLSTSVYGKIRQLIMSPNGAFLAVLTDNTVHIAVLPDPSHLAGPDSSPIRVRTHQLGPTTHVRPESPVVSALWHPLGVFSNLGGCIVTVTADAAVRVWELDRNNNWSFDKPTVAIDLKKLVDGTSLDEDFAPSGFGKNKGFSVDSFDMEVASACFGGIGADDEDGWAAMTLWVAMKTGDVYALCPLLPTKWRVPSTTIPSLTSSIIPKASALKDEFSEADDEERAYRQQFEWLKEIDEQEPAYISTSGQGLEGQLEIRERPAKPSAVPRLQGPFEFDLIDEEEELDVTDILVVASKVDKEYLANDDDESSSLDNTDDGLSATVICLITATGRVHVCLELDGIHGQWLPQTKKNAFFTPVSDPSDLVLIESLETVRTTNQQPHSWPTFTRDNFSRYGLFITSANSVAYISLTPWVHQLEAELQSPDTAGSDFRLKVLTDGLECERQLILRVYDEQPTASTAGHLASSVVISDFNLGYLLLTYTPSRPYAAVLEPPPIAQLSTDVFQSAGSDASTPQQTVVFPPRCPYQPPAIFYTEFPLTDFIDKYVPHRHRNAMKEEVRLSPSTLDIVASAHRLLSSHTDAIERAAADLFRRCERLRSEMRDQAKQLSEASERIKDVSCQIGEGGHREDGARSETILNQRLQAASERQKELVARAQRVRNKVVKNCGKPLSDKERAWVEEVEKMSKSIDKSGVKNKDDVADVALRLETAKTHAEDLITQGKRVAERAANASDSSTPTSSPGGSQVKVPPKLYKARVAEAMNMVNRESAVIEAMASKLERLNTSLSP